MGELLKYNASARAQPSGSEDIMIEDVDDKAKAKRRGNKDKKKTDKPGREVNSSGEPQTIALSKEIWAEPQAAAAQRAAADAFQAYLGMSMAAYAGSAYAAAAAAYAANQPPGHTTVMLRNIPNRYTRDMLVNRLNEKFDGQYDFVYLPIDFNSKCNVGYAFINFRTPLACQQFTQEFHNVRTRHCLPGFSSQKICEVSQARVQGRDANMENLRDEKFIEKLIERPEWQPLFFNDEGQQVAFTSLVGGGNDGKGPRRTSIRSSKATQQASANTRQAPQPSFPGLLPGYPFPAYGGYPPAYPGYPFPYGPGYPPPMPPPGAGVPGIPYPEQLAAQAAYSAKAARQAAAAQPSYIDYVPGRDDPSWPSGEVPLLS